MPTIYDVSLMVLPYIERKDLYNFVEGLNRDYLRQKFIYILLDLRRENDTDYICLQHDNSYKVSEKYYEILGAIFKEYGMAIKMGNFNNCLFKYWISWKSITRLPLTERFIDRYEKNLSWREICELTPLTENLIEIYIDNLDWNCIFASQDLDKLLSNEFINRYAHKVNFRKLSKKFSLEEARIEKFSEYINWDYVAAYQKLSEEFIERHMDKLDWINILHHQALSCEFIAKYEDIIDWDALSLSECLMDGVITRYYHKLNWDYINDLSEWDFDTIHEYEYWRDMETHL